VEGKAVNEVMIGYNRGRQGIEINHASSGCIISERGSGAQCKAIKITPINLLPI
jgi:hypothetical protein